MLESQDLKEIKNVVQDTIQAAEQRLDKRFDDFAGLMNRSLLDTEKRLGIKIDTVDQRIDKLYSLVDGFIALHQKLDQELTMLRARMDRMEQELQTLRAQAAH